MTRTQVSQRLNRRKLQNNIDEVVYLYREGQSLRKIAEFFGVSTQAVITVLDTAGVNRRSISDAKTLDSDQNCFEYITDESAYWIGFLMADGSVHAPQSKTGKHKIKLAISSKDEPHLFKMKEFTKTESSVRTYDSYSVLSITSDIMVDSLQKWGVTQRKSFTAKAHPYLEYNTHFWRGVVDGDGCISLKNRSVSLAGSKFLCSQFLAWGRTVYDCKSALVKRSYEKVYRVNLSVQKCVPLLYGGNPTYYLDRKMSLAKELIDSSKIGGNDGD